jgi:hypothetical protein
VPSGASTGPITVDGLTSNDVDLTAPNAGLPLTLTTVSPNVGPVQDGQQTPLTGTNFVSGTTVKIWNKPVLVLTLVSAVSMIVQVQPSVPGPADAVVTDPNEDAVLQNGHANLSGALQKIVAITPTMGLINIPRNTPVTVSFSLSSRRSRNNYHEHLCYAFNDTVVTFRPTATLAASTAYTLSLVQGIKSVDGVPLDGPFTSSFTTGSGSDTVSPTVTITPVDGATNVPFRDC